MFLRFFEAASSIFFFARFSPGRSRLVQSGKVHFGAIYGLSVTGSVALWALLNLMSDQGISIYTTVSVWGYCLLPMVILAFLSLAMPLAGIVGIILTAVCVVWCTLCAAAMFVQASHLVNQRLLIAYPLALFYTCFALFTIF
jgi:protein YIPF5/7